MSVNAIQGVASLSHLNVTSSLPSSSNPSPAPSQSDMSWFSAALQPAQKADTETNVAERIVGQLAGSSAHLQKLSDHADRALKKASRSSDPQDVIQANRSLSSFYLESLLTTKLISKGTQAVEKLTSLQ